MVRFKIKRRLPGDDGYKVFSIRVKSELADLLDHMAAKAGYSRNGLIGILLETAVKYSEIGPDEP